MPRGTALYLRRIAKDRHGTPKQLAKRCADHGLRWIAIGALWQDLTKAGNPTSKMINDVETIERYSDAFMDKGVEPYIWGYPWQGREEAFVEAMLAVDKYGRILLDPELGSNPSRDAKGPGKRAADNHATKLVRLFAEATTPETVLGLSTYGGGYRMKWFPLIAFTRALLQHFRCGRTFIGGQTYTVPADLVDTSIADMVKVIEKVGGVVMGAERRDRKSVV